MITPESPWRTTGLCPPGDWDRVLSTNIGNGAADAAYDVAADLSLLCLGQMGPESNYGDSDIYDKTGNLLGLRPRPNDKRPVYQHPTKGPFLKFGSPAECIAEWRARILDPTYKGGVYTPGTTTIIEYVNVYAPASDGNNPTAYANRIVADMNYWLSDEEATVPEFTTEIPGLPKPITTSFPVRVALMPASQTNQRPGQPFTGGSWDRYCQHETANTGRGANVRMHEAWLRNGAGGQQLGFHLCVDDKEAAVFVPLDEIAWHAGDSGGPGNYDSIACELCVNSDGDQAKARTNAEELAAAVLAARGLGTDRLVQHNYFSGKDCPAIMRREGYWPTFVANVGKRLQAPPSGGDYPDGMDKDLAARWFGSVTVDGKVFAYSEGQPLSSLWLDTGRQTGHYPQLVGVETYDTRTYWTFEGGWTAWRPNANEPVRVLKG